MMSATPVRYSVGNGNGSLVLSRGDITKWQGDAIVNSMRWTSLLPETRPTARYRYLARVIHDAAGDELQQACAALQPEPGSKVRCPRGAARITSAGKLPANHVIHTVIDQYHEANSEDSLDLLRSCYASCFKQANQTEGVKSLAFPALGTGRFRYPYDKAAEVAIKAVLQHIGHLERVEFVLPKDAAYAAFAAMADLLLGLPQLPDGFIMPGGGDSDAASYSDSLGVRSAAKGTATFLLHPETAAMAVAVYGPWGRGKSTFMRLVEQEMLLTAAQQQAGKTSTITHAETQLEEEGLDEATFKKIEVLARPRLMTAWFNAWQYLNETQVWSGLVVELVKALEQQLSWGQRRRIAWQFHWRKRRAVVLLRLVLPIVALLAVVASLMAYGIARLDEHQCKEFAADGTCSEKTDDAKTSLLAARAAVAIAGTIVALLAVVERTTAVMKQVSDSMLDSLTYLSIEDHKDKIGFQQEVIEDMSLLKELLQAHSSSGCGWFSTAKHAAAGVQQWLQGLYGTSSSTNQPKGQDRPELQLAGSGANGLRIAVFIDDLDRCKPSKVIEVLEAVNIVLAPSGFSVVIGMDKGFIHGAVMKAYDGQIDEDKAEEFLQKIVQVSLTLPRPNRQAIQCFLDKLCVTVTPSGATTDGPAAVHKSQIVHPSPDKKENGSSNSSPSSSIPSSSAAADKSPDAPASPDETDMPIPGRSSSSAISANRSLAEKPGPSAAAAAAASDMLPVRPLLLQRMQLLAKGGYSQQEVDTIQQFLDNGLLDDVSPREIKRLLNHFRLAKLILIAEGDGKLDDEDRCCLLVWVLLWWRYPGGMHLLERVPQLLSDNDNLAEDIRGWAADCLDNAAFPANLVTETARQQLRSIAELLEMEETAGLYKKALCARADKYRLLGMELGGKLKGKA